MGNGTLLATFDSMGEIEQLFAPNIDALQSKIGVFRSAVLLEKAGEPLQIIPVIPEEFETHIRLLSGTQILHAEYRHRKSDLTVVRRIGMHPTDATMLDTWEISESSANSGEKRAGVWHQCIPWMGNSTSAHCSLFHPDFNGIVHHRGKRWLGIFAKERIQWVRVGHLNEHDRSRLWSGERIAAPIGASDLHDFPHGSSPLGWDQVVQGPATWGSFAALAPQDDPLQPGGNSRIEFVIICAESEPVMDQMLKSTKSVPAKSFFQMIDGMSARRLAPANDILERISHAGVRALAERSIDVLHALQDTHTGALMAAAEVDPHSRVSGGYGYSWPRDGSYLASALGAFGFRERVEHYFKFCQDTQDPSGTWWQRYAATKHAGPSWGRIQIDEPATVIGAAYLHFRKTQDLFWLERIWPNLKKGLTFLEQFHGPKHPLGRPSHDLWEERMGIHAYSLAAVSSAFTAGSFLAHELGDQRLEKHYREWGRALAQIISEKFLGAEGPIRRSFVTSSWNYEDPSGYWDEAADISMLGLIYPFGIFKKTDVAAKRVVAQLREKLWNHQVGGIIRYEQDTYRGGNPWILTTLWLATVDLATGDLAHAKESFDWVMEKATSTGMLAEQVHRETGQPCWVIPLAWSHAMFLLFVREVLDRHLEKEIWG